MVLLLLMLLSLVARLGAISTQGQARILGAAIKVGRLAKGLVTGIGPKGCKHTPRVLGVCGHGGHSAHSSATERKR